MAIYIEIEQNLAKEANEGGKPHSFYRLGKETGIPQNTLSRLRQGSKSAIEQAEKEGRTIKPLDSISFPILEKICRALKCEISDILKLE